MKKPSIKKEIITDNQLNKTQKKLEKILGHLDPLNPPETCPIRDVLASVTDKWSILIIVFLGAYTTLRFNGLKKIVRGVSSKTLSERLKKMERDGYLTRKVYPEVPIRVEYTLTEFGFQYLDLILNLIEWIEKKTPEVIKSRIKFDLVKPVENND